MNISHSRNPKVTILIPVYNEQNHLPACLDCIIKQTYNPELIEVILLNGGSTDETFSVASEYQNRYTRIQIVQFPRLNIPQLLNAGAMRANGEVLVRA